MLSLVAMFIVSSQCLAESTLVIEIEGFESDEGLARIVLFDSQASYQGKAPPYRRVYGERRRTLVESLKTELGEILSFDDHQAGMQFVARLPDDYDDITIARAARAAGIIIVALSTHYAGRNKQSGLLISFCGYENEGIDKNISKLKNIPKRFR